MDALEQGPQISICIRSKASKATELCEGKGSLFCLAIWHALQLFDLWLMQEYFCLRTSNLLFEGWPKWLCHILLSAVVCGCCVLAECTQGAVVRL